MLDMSKELNNENPMIAQMVLINSNQLATTVDYMHKEYKKLMGRVDDAL